jgi:hypothetical protein
LVGAGFCDQSGFQNQNLPMNGESKPTTIEGSQASRWSASKLNQKGGLAADRFAPAPGSFFDEKMLELWIIMCRGQVRSSGLSQVESSS